MAMMHCILKKGVVGVDGERYVMVGGPRRVGKFRRLFVYGDETWCLTCGRVQPDNGGGLCVADGCDGTNIGRAPGDCQLDDGEHDLTPEEIIEADGTDNAPGELVKIVIWDFPPADFQAAVATGMCGFASYHQYISVLDAAQKALECDGHTVERVCVGVDEMLARLAALGLRNTPSSRATVAATTARPTNH